MPSMILSKAASTAVDGPAAGVVRPVAGVEDGVASGALLAGLGVGVGFGATVRPRLDEELVLVFCAAARPILTNRIETATIDLFMTLAPQDRCQKPARKQELVSCGTPSLSKVSVACAGPPLRSGF